MHAKQNKKVIQSIHGFEEILLATTNFTNKNLVTTATI